jgi:hypothetical protein
MAQFGIRYLDWDRAHQTPRVPYEDWNVDEYSVFNTFEEAKEQAALMEKLDIRTHEIRNPDYDINDRWSTPRYIRVPIEGANPYNKYLAYKIPPEQNYLEREKAKIEAGEYEPLPNHMWPYSSDYVFPRLTQDKTMIGYYSSPRDAKFDRLTECKPTRFFSQWWNYTDMWDYMAELGLAAAGLTLAWATTREDIRFVYEKGPESCMSAEAHRYYRSSGDNAIHPTEAYASPDLALAYLYRGDDATEEDVIVARALCNVNTKEYVRIYGDIDRMRKSLEELGYSENQYCLGGCRLLKIFPKTSDGVVDKQHVMTPYLDGMCQQIMFKMDEEYMTIKPAEFLISGSTSGYCAIC